MSSPSSPPPLPSSSPLSLAFICLPIATECPGEEEASARRGEAEYEEGTTTAAVPLRCTPQLRWYVCTTCNSQGQTGLELGVVAPLPFFLSEDSSLFHFSITLFDFPHDSWAHAHPRDSHRGTTAKRLLYLHTLSNNTARPLHSVQSEGDQKFIAVGRGKERVIVKGEWKKKVPSSSSETPLVRWLGASLLLLLFLVLQVLVKFGRA